MDLISIPRAARETGIDAQTLRAAVRSGDLVALRPGTGERAHFFVDRAELAAWLDRIQERAKESA
jgi:hypothetical protein